MTTDRTPSPSFRKAAAKAADFWMGLLRTGTTEVVRGSLNNEVGKGSRDSIATEYRQAGVSTLLPSQYTDEQVRTFRAALERLILENNIERVSMRYHPDEVLAAAGAAAGIDIDMFTFPVDATTYYSEAKETLSTSQGRHANPEKVYLNPDRPVTKAFLVYQTERDGPIRTMAFDEDDAPHYVDTQQRQVADKEGVPPFTVHVWGPLYATEESAAIRHAVDTGYKFMTPQEAANHYLGHAHDAEEVEFLVRERGADVNANGGAPLVHALRHENAQIANSLVALGATFSEAAQAILREKQDAATTFTRRAFLESFKPPI